MFKKIKKRISLCKLILFEILETLATICLYLEHDGRVQRNPCSKHMYAHFETLKSFSEEIRNCW